MILELQLTNTETTPTYINENKTFVVDLIFVDLRSSRKGSSLRISDRYTSSDYQVLAYQLQPTNSIADMTRILNRVRSAPATFVKETFLNSLEEASVGETAEFGAQSLPRTITAACHASVSTRTNHRKRLPVHW